MCIHCLGHLPPPLPALQLYSFMASLFLIPFLIGLSLLHATKTRPIKVNDECHVAQYSWDLRYSSSLTLREIHVKSTEILSANLTIYESIKNTW
jgi:hypothetical protein